MPVIDMKSRATVPLVGQPLAVLGYTAVVSMQCRCEQTGYVTMILTQGQSGSGAGIAQCPSCQRPYHIQGIQVDANGQLVFQIGMGEPQTLVKSN